MTVNQLLGIIYLTKLEVVSWRQ